MKKSFERFIWSFIFGCMVLCLLHVFHNLKFVKETNGKVKEPDIWEAPKVAITFDDGPNQQYTPKLLEGLRKRSVKASFFVLGKNISGNEALLKQMYQEGHLIGNHTYNHVQLNKIPIHQAKQEIEKTSNAVYQATGYYPVYIRPPFGEWRKDLEFSVTMVPVLWDIDTLDWKTKNINSSVEIVRKQVKDGSIILMHDGYDASVTAAFEIIDMLLTQGYEFVTVDRLLVM